MSKLAMRHGHSDSSYSRGRWEDLVVRKKPFSVRRRVVNFASAASIFLTEAGAGFGVFQTSGDVRGWLIAGFIGLGVIGTSSIVVLYDKTKLQSIDTWKSMSGSMYDERTMLLRSAVEKAVEFEEAAKTLPNGKFVIEVAKESILDLSSSLWHHYEQVGTLSRRLRRVTDTPFSKKAQWAIEQHLASMRDIEQELARLASSTAELSLVVGLDKGVENKLMGINSSAKALHTLAALREYLDSLSESYQELDVSGLGVVELGNIEG